MEKKSLPGAACPTTAREPLNKPQSDTGNTDTALDELSALIPRLPSPQKMSNSQKEKERKILSARLKDLNSVPRSDWHESFEYIMQLEIESWNNGSRVDREVSIGESAPRADFIIITGKKLPEFVKTVFRIFLKKNALEYKRPDDVLTEQMVWKTAGYGNLLIGTDRDFDKNDMTLTLFAYRKNKKQFSSMLGQGVLSETAVRGIYAVNGLTRLPYQVVLIDELEGIEYAAFRALSDHAATEDVSLVMTAMKKSAAADRDRYHNILQTIEAHNPGAVKQMIVEDRNMESIFMPLFETQIQARVDEEVKATVDAAVEAAVKAAVEAAVKDAVEAAVKDAVKKNTETVSKSVSEASFKTVAERLIQNDIDGQTISIATGYDRSHIDSIAQSLNHAVAWNNTRV